MALDLPEGERAALASWRDELIADRDDLRPVAEEALHVTLAFLGYRPETEAVAIAEAMARGAGSAAPPLLRPAEVVPLPPSRPRLFALGLEEADGDCSQLQQSISDALEAGRFYKPERRPFWPHVTLARVKRDRRADPLPAAPPPLKPFRAAQVTLYRSLLRPEGARYEALECLALGSP